ncbi:hypothetical protein WJX75_000261 [Coccomyxa subellipsoidea]|uniref:HECT-type E3 ubiquitin transferase n=1 Tax=Coccomyxa subellipsoidea TaxID=248742 RepID=A0ABR2YEN4_9CHLO
MTTTNEGSSKPDFLDVKLDFKARVERLFLQLTQRKLSSNQAAAYSLQLASFQVDHLVDPADYPLELDFAKVDEVFNAIVRSENGGLLDAFVEGCRDIAEHLENAPPGPITVQAACALLQNPLLEDPEHDWMLTDLFEVILGWDKGMKKEFTAMLLSYPSERFQGLIQKAQQVVTLGILDDQLDSKLQTALQLMQLLFKVNLKSRHVPIAEFYNDAVNDEEYLAENLKKDYIAWSNGPSRATRPFSLCSYPFVYEPAAKATILGMSNFNTQMGEFHDALRESMSWGGGSAVPFLVLRVRRGDHLVHDTLLQIQNAGMAIRRPLKVQFIGEEGVDEGGVQKEFFQLLMRELFDANFGMFRMDPELRTFWFRASSLDLAMEFELVGLMLALAIYNNHILEVSFPMVVYKMLMGRDVGFEDLKDVHPDVYSSLKKLLAYQGDFSELGLVFQVEQEADFGEPNLVVDLIPKGGEVAVTAENRQQYVTAYVQHLLTKSVKRQSQAFCKGFKKLWSKDLVFKLFQPEELECLICGSTELDFAALESAVHYEDGFDGESPVVTWFWEVVHGFSEEQKKRLLFFVTGSDRVPIKGLASLQPPFVISRNGPSSNRLPTAHTCFNHLLLPAYNDKAILQNRLETAINNAEGFGLR